MRRLQGLPPRYARCGDGRRGLQVGDNQIGGVEPHQEVVHFVVRQDQVLLGEGVCQLGLHAVQIQVGPGPCGHVLSF
ncbi:hypothetical protein LCGC14_3154460 [marine sediment metagenome]|uniref:Uncharacterized protein n=1 Tax=marine sediment metagenome TaxID=412755 RepID=A0A0F8WH62_9ZZZZ